MFILYYSKLFVFWDNYFRKLLRMKRKKGVWGGLERRGKGFKKIRWRKSFLYYLGYCVDSDIILELL